MSESLPKKHKKWLYLYAKGPCDKCACTICEAPCDRNISPCKRCDIPGNRMLRKPLLACIEFGNKKKGGMPLINCEGKKITSPGKVIRGIVPDDWETS